MSDLTVVIPSRNEPWLQKTIDDILEKSRADTNVIVCLDGYNPNPQLKESDKLRIIPRDEARGLRDGINSMVALTDSKFIMKCDAHCMFSDGFDVALMRDCEPNWIAVPIRKRLIPETWSLEEVPGRPDVTYMYLTYPYKADGSIYGMHGKNWNGPNAREDLRSIAIDDLMTQQGSCYFMRRDYFYELELMDAATYGSFRDEFLEVGMKCWLSGGRVVVNKNAWYAHWHKKVRGYDLPNESSRSEIWMEPNAWRKQTLPIKWLIKKFYDKFGDFGWPKAFYE